MKSYQPSAIGYRLIFRGAARCALIIFLLFTFHFSLFTVHAEKSLTREQRLAVFDNVWKTIEERYYDRNLHGVNWAAQRDKFRVQAAAAANSAELYRVIKQMVGRLRDSHTRVSAPEEKTDWRSPRFISVGVTVREIENELVFVQVDKDSSAARSGVKVGDVLATIDNVSAAVVFERRLREQPGASTAAIERLRAAAGIFGGAEGSLVRVGFRRAKDNKVRSALLRRTWHTVPASIKARRAGSTLIVAFDAFTPEIAREFYQILQNEIQSARGIVVDLRANRGGSTEAMIDIASAFLPENKIIGRFIDRRGNTELEASTRRKLFHTANAVKIPALPVVILTSTATASAAEIFAAALKKAGRARTMGTATCGCVLAVKGQHALPDGGALEVSELDFQMPDGARLESVGVAVDEKITLTRRDLLARRDPALELALKQIKS